MHGTPRGAGTSAITTLTLTRGTPTSTTTTTTRAATHTRTAPATAAAPPPCLHLAAPWRRQQRPASLPPILPACPRWRLRCSSRRPAAVTRRRWLPPLPPAACCYCVSSWAFRRRSLRRCRRPAGPQQQQRKRKRRRWPARHQSCREKVRGAGQEATAPYSRPYKPLCFAVLAVVAPPSGYARPLPPALPHPPPVHAVTALVSEVFEHAAGPALAAEVVAFLRRQRLTSLG